MLLPTEILVRVYAAGINPLDLRTSAGLANQTVWPPVPDVRLAPEPLVEPDGHGLSQLAQMVDEGKLTIHLDRIFPLARVAEAHAHAEAGATGKTVLDVTH